MSSLYLDPKSESPIKVHKSMTIGRDFLRIAGPDYKYVSNEQFKIKEKGKDWYIEPIPGTTNSTYLNGKELAGEKRLRDGDEILIGNINSGVGLNLDVRVEEEQNLVRQDRKYERYADLVFLIDANESMEPMVNGLKDEIDFLSQQIKKYDEVNRHTDLIIKTKVVPFKDVWKYGEKAVDLSNPFVEDFEEVKRQFNAIKFSDHKDSPKGVFDAIYLTIKKTKWNTCGWEYHMPYHDIHGTPPKSEDENYGYRFLVFLANSPPRDILDESILEAGEERNLERVFKLIMEARISFHLLVSSDISEEFRKFGHIPRNFIQIYDDEVNYNTLFDSLFEHIFIVFDRTIS